MSQDNDHGARLLPVDWFHPKLPMNSHATRAGRHVLEGMGDGAVGRGQAVGRLHGSRPAGFGPKQLSEADNPAPGGVMVEPVELLQLADELARRAEGKPGDAAQAVLAAHAALEAAVNRLEGVEIQSFTLPFRKEPGPVEPERLDRRATTPPPEVPDGPPSRLRVGDVGHDLCQQVLGHQRGRRPGRVIAEFHQAAGREVPSWAVERTGHQGAGR